MVSFYRYSEHKVSCRLRRHHSDNISFLASLIRIDHVKSCPSSRIVCEVSDLSGPYDESNVLFTFQVIFADSQHLQITSFQAHFVDIRLSCYPLYFSLLPS